MVSYLTVLLTIMYITILTNILLYHNPSPNHTCNNTPTPPRPTTLLPSTKTFETGKSNNSIGSKRNLITMADDSEEKDTKRRRVLDPAEQRAAFIEDMERIRSSGMMGGAPTAAGGEEEEEEKSAGAAESTLQQHQSQQPSGSFTTQQQQHAQGGGGQSRSTGVMDSDDDEDGNNWLQNYTPHHTRVGSDYQVADLPPVPSRNGAEARTSDTISGRVSPGASGGSGEG